MTLHTFSISEVRLLVAAIFLGSLLAPTVQAQAQAAAPTGWHFTPLIESVISPPHWFTGTDGKVHLVYELLLTNALTVPATVSTIAVLNADSGATLLRLTGPSLTSAMSLVTSPDAPNVVLPPATVGAVWLDVPLASKEAIPAFIAHQVTIAPASGVPPSVLSFTGARVKVDRRPPVVLGPPLAGSGWAALGSCCDGPHRRSVIPIGGRRYLGQRFAIDFNQLDAQNRPGVGDPALPASFPTFGQPVLAVTDATVAVAVDRYPDLRVGAAREDITPQSEGGNRIVLDLGDGRFAAYAHLQAGSVKVRPGDRVKRGQPMANAGSSGTGGGPHVHFQVMDHPSLLFADGLPYVFDAFALTGQTPSLVKVLPYYDTLEAIPITSENVGPQRHALPMSRDVVTFSALPLPQIQPGSAAISGSAATQCAPGSAVPSATSRSLSATLESIREKYQLNAIIVGVEQHGKPLYRNAIGVSTNGEPATTDMHFRVGGVGWQVLSTVLLRMAEQQPARIALTDRVSKWYPDYPNADRATVRMLSASSAGFGDYITTDAFLRQLEANPLRVWTADDLIAYSVLPHQAPAFKDPGRDWKYSHTDFVVLGAILEKASGKKYAALLQEFVFDPLVLRNTRFQLDAKPQLPVLQTLQEEDFQESTFWNPSWVSWAALTSNICDLGKWNRAFGTGSLLSPAMRSEPVAPINVGLGANTAQAFFGLGTLVYPPWIVQRAAYWGMHTSTAYDPTTGISLVATVSLSPATPPGEQPGNEIITAISKLLTPDHPVPK